MEEINTYKKRDDICESILHGIAYTYKKTKIPNKIKDFVEKYDIKEMKSSLYLSKPLVIENKESQYDCKKSKTKCFITECPIPSYYLKKNIYEHDSPKNR